MLMNDQAIAKIAKPSFSPSDVEHVAAERLQHDRDLERADDPRVLLRGDVEVVQQRRRGHAERAAGQVVDDRRRASPGPIIHQRSPQNFVMFVCVSEYRPSPPRVDMACRGGLRKF